MSQPECLSTGPWNNHVLSFNNQKLVFNQQGGAVGYSVTPTNIPTALAANGVYDQNGELIFLVTYEPDFNQYYNLVGYNKFGQKFYLYKKSALSGMGSNPIGLGENYIENKIVIFQVPGKCDEYYIIHPTEPVPSGNDYFCENAMTRVKFNSADHTLVQITSGRFGKKNERQVTLVSPLLRDVAQNINMGSGIIPNPNYNKLFVNVFSFGQKDKPYSYLDFRNFVSKFRVYEDYFYGPNGSIGEVEIPFLNPKINGQEILVSEIQNCPYVTCPPFNVKDGIIIEQTNQRLRILLVGDKGLITDRLGSQNYGQASPMWLYQENYSGTTAQTTYSLKSYNTNLVTSINGIAALDGDQTNNTIDRLFYSHTRTGSSAGNYIYAVRDFAITNGPPEEFNILLFPIRQEISSATNLGDRSALEISFDNKYLVYPKVPSSGSASLELLSLDGVFSNPITVDMNALPSYNLPQINTFYQGTNIATNGQLFRQRYFQRGNTLMPTCQDNRTFTNEFSPLPTGTIGPLAHLNQWIKADANTFIETNTRADFVAGQYVQLLPNFRAKPNSTFRAAIEVCPYASICCQNAIDLGDGFSLLGGRRNVAGLEPEDQDWDFSFENPAEELINLKIINLEFFTAELKDGLGRRVKTWDQNQKEIGVAGLPRGLYFITLKSSLGAKTKKILLD